MIGKRTLQYTVHSSQSRIQPSWELQLQPQPGNVVLFPGEECLEGRGNAPEHQQQQLNSKRTLSKIRSFLEGQQNWERKSLYPITRFPPQPQLFFCDVYSCGKTHRAWDQLWLGLILSGLLSGKSIQEEEKVWQLSNHFKSFQLRGQSALSSEELQHQRHGCTMDMHDVNIIVLP